MKNVQAPASTTFIEVIPDPQEVRSRLGQALRETKILRQLLKVAENAAKERQMQRPWREAANA